ncbi:hypothetical protein T08_2340 [Trichinella sp. T8]|nr:hypothetical protein T08_2340 [Trichinella sp. T8]
MNDDFQRILNRRPAVKGGSQCVVNGAVRCASV